MMLRLTRLEAATAIVAAGQAATALFVATMGSPDRVPVHFSAGGVDRWGDRYEAALIIGLMAAISLIGGGVLAWSARGADVGRRRGLALAQVILLAVTTILAAMIATLASASLDPVVAGPRVVMMASCGVFAVIGAVLGKVPQNRLVGIRTPWSRSSRLAWEKSNRLAGRLFFGLGLLGLLVLPALPAPMAHGVLLAGILIAAALSVFESWRVWRTDPERNAA